MSHRRVRTVLAFTVLAVLGLSSYSKSTLDSPALDTAWRSIRPEAIRAHMRFLSDSRLEGRAPDSPGYEIAAHYVADQLESLRLHPASLEPRRFLWVAFWPAPPFISSITLILERGTLNAIQVDRYGCIRSAINDFHDHRAESVSHLNFLS
jgi:hypothetical protein